MAVNKVVMNTEDGEVVLMDLTSDSVTPDTLAEGETAHDATGNPIVGRMVPGSSSYGDISLGIHTDGLLYIFINGVPTGNGVAIPDGAGDVFGNVDSGNNIVLQGALANGTYTVKYEMTDGSVVNIGNLVLDTTVYYTVTKNLAHCSINNSAVSVAEGESYSATITANDGYELNTVTVTMGGSPVTVTDGVINIARVTGDIVITAVAEEKTSGIINQIPISTDANGNLFVGTKGEKGYKTDTRISGSSGGESSAADVETTGFIPMKHGDTMYIKGIVDDGTHVVCFYNSSRTKIIGWGWSTEFPNGLDGSIASFTLGFGNFAGSGVENTAFVRLSANEITDSSIVTINQPIE